MSEFLFSTPLVERPSRARSRSNAVQAHRRRRLVAHQVTDLLVGMRSKKRGRVCGEHEVEKVRRKASRLVGRARMRNEE